MSNETLTSKKIDDEGFEKDTPLSDEEISRLIQASRETSFKRKEIKKEMSESFKKVSLHDIAKKYSKDIFAKREENENSNKESTLNESINTKDSKENEDNKKEEEQEDILEVQNNTDSDETKINDI